MVLSNEWLLQSDNKENELLLNGTSYKVVEWLQLLQLVQNQEVELFPNWWYDSSDIPMHFAWNHWLHSSQATAFWFDLHGFSQKPHGYLTGPGFVSMPPIISKMSRRR